MKVSIITVCFNAEDSIEETINSVLSQSYLNIDYVIIDGKSTDNTVSIINKYRKRLAYFVSENDSGIYEAMNKGIKAATGDILFFLNADDMFYDSSVIEKIVRVFVKSDVDLLYGNVILVDKTTGVTLIKRHNNLDKMYFLDNTICHQALFFKAGAFRKCGLFDEGFRIAADYEWLLRALFNYRLRSCHVDLPITFYNMGGMSCNKRFEQLLAEERNKIIQTYFSKSEIDTFTSPRIRKLAQNFPALKTIYWRIHGWNLP